MVSVKNFGTTKEGRQAHLIALTNKSGMSLHVTDFGASLVSILAPDKSGDLEDVILGFDDVSGYEDNSYYMGATIGRHAGQIEKGVFTLNGKTYHTVINDFDNTMHGGPGGFHSRLFNIESLTENSVIFKYLSKDGEANFPGNLNISVTYILSDDNSFCLDFDGECDADTILSMTNHAYFNLNGPQSESILEHKLKIYAEKYTEVDEQGLPTGNVFPVSDTPYDFREFRSIGERISYPDKELQYCGGYDHNWVLPEDDGVRLCCELTNDDGSRRLQIFSNQPGFQMYSGNHLNGSKKGKNGIAYVKQSAMCLEPQVYPNGLNNPHFPSPILKSGQLYKYRSVYKFTS